MQVGTRLMKLLSDDYFHPDKTPDLLSVNRLIELGILMCDGEVAEKVIVFWHLVVEGE